MSGPSSIIRSGMNDPQREKASGEELRQVVKDIVDDGSSLGHGEPLRLQMADDLIDHPIDRKVGACR